MSEVDTLTRWSEARDFIMSMAKETSDAALRRWTSRNHAREALQEMFSDEIRVRRATQAIREGDCGVCVKRLLYLNASPSMDGEPKGKLVFGDLYTVSEVNDHEGSVSVRTADGVEGWISRPQYFEITQGEYKILSGSKSRTLNFLVTAIHL